MRNIKSRGFTIVELLVVIVVIGILAAITVVSYTGVTNRANKASAQTAAASIISKSEVYYTDGPTGLYPASLSALTGAASSTTYYLSGVSLDATALSTSNTPTSPSEINFYKCGHSGTVTAPTTLATVTNVTGVRVDYWNYDTAVETKTAGQTSGSVGTYPVACIISNA